MKNNGKKIPQKGELNNRPNERKWNRMETDKYHMKTVRENGHTDILTLAQIYIVSELDEIRERQTNFDFSQLQIQV